jgi:hypothetical protein
VNDNSKSGEAARGLPSHHDTHPLDCLEIDRIRMLLFFTTIGRLQIRPWNEYKATFLKTALRETRLEVVLPRNSGLFTSIVWIAGKQLILEDEGVSFVCEFLGMSLMSCTRKLVA